MELIFDRFLKKEPDLQPSVGSLQGWLLKAYIKMKERLRNETEIRGMESTSRRSGSLQESSRIRRSITKKFIRPHDGPWKVTGGVNTTMYEVTSQQGEVTNVYNQTELNSYLPTYGVKKSNYAYSPNGVGEATNR